MYTFPDAVDSGQRVHFDGDNLPSLKTWKPGQRYTLEIIVELKEKHQVDDKQGKDVTGSFEIIEVKDVASKKIKDMSRPQFNKHLAKARAGELKNNY